MHEQHLNHLAGEKSPYLQQHACNPVDWYPWGEEALSRARNEDKPLIISIGYAACHWCHVMEKESFSDPGIAALMNEDFVCIKIDREERPDLDHVYMTAVQLIHRHGGWPLNAFALPDGRPFYGGTYFRPAQWVDLLQQISRLYRLERAKVERQASEISQGVAQSHLVTLSADEGDIEGKKPRELFEKMHPALDKIYGGSRGAPKFPMPVLPSFLIRYAILNKDEKAKAHLELSLDRMASGGIYDHVGGGFARYSVDEKWHIPHFEKMLYDNAQLISLYAEAYRYLGKPRYKEVIRQSIHMLEEVFLVDGAGFSSSLDADSEGEEGKYYVWSLEEIREGLGEEANIFNKAYQIGGEAHWEEGKQVLYLLDDLSGLAEQEAYLQEDLEAILARSRRALKSIRDNRVPPALDDKVITAWNAMMVIAYLDAYAAIKEEVYLNKAIDLARFILGHLKTEAGGLYRTWKGGMAYTTACLEDYAWMIQALLRLYQLTFSELWLQEAREMTTYTIKHFYDPSCAMFWFSSDQVDIPVTRGLETHDNVIPSSNAVMARNLYHLGLLTEDDRYHTLARQAMTNMIQALFQYPEAYLYWGMLFMEMQHGMFKVVFSGRETVRLRDEMLEVFDPWRLMAQASPDSAYRSMVERSQPEKTLIFVCTSEGCLPPVDNSQEALGILSSFKPPIT